MRYDIHTSMRAVTFGATGFVQGLADDCGQDWGAGELIHLHSFFLPRYPVDTVARDGLKTNMEPKLLGMDSAGSVERARNNIKQMTGGTEISTKFTAHAVCAVPDRSRSVTEAEIHISS